MENDTRAQHSGRDTLYNNLLDDVVEWIATGEGYDDCRVDSDAMGLDWKKVRSDAHDYLDFLGAS